MAELSIGIMSVYFGQLPEYFPVWLESCKKNPTINFIVVTDQDVNWCIPNVKFVRSSLKQVQKQASAAMGFEVTLDTPFKLCDYKPAYGVIFEDLLKQYDYWGNCDIDLIWGDLRSFFNQHRLEEYDKFLPLGHLSLYRNTHENNRRFMNPMDGLSDYRKIFQSQQNYLFDELAINRIFKNNYLFFDKIIFADIWPSKKRYTICTKLSYYPSIYKEFAKRCNPVNFKNQIFMWVEGKIYQYYVANKQVEKREFLYIHIQKRKWKLKGDFSDRMVISRNSVIAVEEDADVSQLIQTHNPYIWMEDVADDFFEFLQHCWSYFKRKIIKVEPNRIVVEK